MAKVKQTKTELKAQSDALKRFERFLPMLQLKKQQLQAELALIAAQAAEVRRREERMMRELESWVKLFAAEFEPAALHVTVERLNITTRNIAGVAVPCFDALSAHTPELDLYDTPAWYDEANEMLKAIMGIRAERLVLERQAELITRELTTTSQRVNLFEKVKIPECRENIRIIKIAIGDEQTAAITRGKIAKKRTGAAGGAQEHREGAA